MIYYILTANKYIYSIYFSNTAQILIIKNEWTA